MSNWHPPRTAYKDKGVQAYANQLIVHEVYDTAEQAAAVADAVTRLLHYIATELPAGNQEHADLEHSINTACRAVQRGK